MKVFLRTYGCQMNERDSENIAAQFEEQGCKITDSEKEADICVVNTCSVREQAEQKAIGKLGHLVGLKTRKTRSGEKISGLPVVGVTGCMAQNLGEKLAQIVPEIDFALGTRKTHLVAETALRIARERISNPVSVPRAPLKKFRKSSAIIDVSDDPSSHLQIYRHNEKILQPCAFVSIMQGCGMNCSYCIVPKVRGKQRSRPEPDIISEIERLTKRGTKEVTLLGQVVNAYGRDFGKPKAFSELLKRINDIDGLERIRFTSPHPSYFRDDLISLYGSLEKLCEYVHLPLQSGNDEILKRMKRPYTSSVFVDIAEKLRERVPDISISTDVIVGYPGETDSQFEDTVKMFQKCSFDMAYIFKYSPREGTLSADKDDDIPEKVKESRNQRLLDVLAVQSSEYNKKYEGQIAEILVEGRAKRGDDTFMGRTRTHRKAVFKSDESKIGKLIKLKINKSSVTTLEGEPLS